MSVHASTLPVTRPVRVTEPTAAQEPITLAQAKHQCKLAPEVSINDEHLQRMIISARQQVEVDAALVCYTGSFTWKLTYFPSRDFLELPDIRPVTSITSIVYTATDGTSTTWTPTTDYGLENGLTTPYVKLAYSKVWPTARGDINGITVTFVAGYSTVPLLPEAIRWAVLLQLNIQWNDFLEMDTAKMSEAYRNHVERLRRRVY